MAQRPIRLESGPANGYFETMRYISTRGGVAPTGFREAVMMGMARDRGLLLPESIPDVRDRLSEWRELSYGRLALELMQCFTDIPRPDLDTLLRQSYASFRNPEVAPVVPVGGLHILELFHGPTLSFKDIALQFMGRLFEYILGQQKRQLNILAATSGDTGSAAIHGVRGRRGVRIFVMHPHGRVSRTQELQMTSVLDDNVFNMAVEGTFDDCQGIMKTLFGDLDFKDRYSLGAVNSINWARLLAQLVYYFYSAFRVMERTGAEAVRFAVPTGNFGDILAGYLACRMGLPVDRLVLATNENDILSRFFNTGTYSLGQVHATVTPSMDIQVASNFERYLFYRLGGDSSRLRRMMETFAATGTLTVEPEMKGPVDPLFAAGAADTEATLETIRRFHRSHGYLLDPHTAVGVGVGSAYAGDGVPMICLATAHPAKFGETIRRATGEDAGHHPILDRLEGLPTRCRVLPATVDAVRQCLVTCMDS